VNKSDLAGPAAAASADFIVSAKDGAGIDVLEAGLADRIAALASSVEAPVITRARHREKLTRGLTALASANAALEGDLGFELVAEDLRLAIREMQGIIGEIGVEDVLGAVFSRFCIGK
jgi:tRNA modification GTPase